MKPTRLALGLALWSGGLLVATLASRSPVLRVAIRGDHDVKGWPVLDPAWRECDEAQLVEFLG